MKPDFGERYFTYSREYEVIEMIWTDDFYDNLFCFVSTKLKTNDNILKYLFGSFEKEIV